MTRTRPDPNPNLPGSALHNPACTAAHFLNSVVRFHRRRSTIATSFAMPPAEHHRPPCRPPCSLLISLPISSLSSFFLGDKITAFRHHPQPFLLAPRTAPNLSSSFWSSTEPVVVADTADYNRCHRSSLTSLHDRSTIHPWVCGRPITCVTAALPSSLTSATDPATFSFLGLVNPQRTHTPDPQLLHLFRPISLSSFFHLAVSSPTTTAHLDPIQICDGSGCCSTLLLSLIDSQHYCLPFLPRSSQLSTQAQQQQPAAAATYRHAQEVLPSFLLNFIGQRQRFTAHRRLCPSLYSFLSFSKTLVPFFPFSFTCVCFHLLNCGGRISN